MPRSGSTLLSLMLNRHEQIHCPPEPWIQLLLAELSVDSATSRLPYDEYSATLAAGELIRQAAALPKNSIRLRTALLNLFSVGRRDFRPSELSFLLYDIFVSKTGKRFFVDKTPRSYHALDFINSAYPAAKKIVLLRNPLDIALSYKTTWGITIDEMIGRNPTHNTVDFAKGLFDLASYASSDRTDTFVLAYEDLVTAPEHLLKIISDFFGVPFMPAMLAFNEDSESLTAQRSSPVGDRKVLHAGRGVDKSSIGNWRSGLTLEEKQDLASFLGKELFVSLGYQKVLEELAEEGVSFPLSDQSEVMRAKALIACGKVPDISSQLGQWVYLAECAGADAGELAAFVEAFAKAYKLNSLSTDLFGSVILDMARRYHASEQDRAKRLIEIEKITLGLQQAGAERVAQMGHIEALTEVIESRPVRFVMKLFRIVPPRFSLRDEIPAQK